MKRDDYRLDPDQQAQIRKQADLLLRKAAAYGRYPTPINDLIGSAELELGREAILDDVFLGGLYRSLPNSIKLAPDTLKRAKDKVLGLLHRHARTIHIDQSVHENKRRFISLHEVGHEFLPWQKKTYAILEDGEQALDNETQDLFERQANCFASDVLFQLDGFAADASDFAFGISAPVKLARRYGASTYAAIRRYAGTREIPCAVLIFDSQRDKDVWIQELTVRRAVASASFEQIFGNNWAQETYRRGEFFVEHVPRNRFSHPASFMLRSLAGGEIRCTAEAFDSTKQVFFLISVPANFDS